MDCFLGFPGFLGTLWVETDGAGRDVVGGGGSVLPVADTVSTVCVDRMGVIVLVTVCVLGKGMVGLVVMLAEPTVEGKVIETTESSHETTLAINS